jgi:hypothetical protein
MTMPADAPAWLHDILIELSRAQVRSEERFAAVEAQLGALTAAQQQTSEELAKHNERLDRLDRLIAQQGELLAQHEERLGRIETRLDQQGDLLAQQGAVLAQHTVLLGHLNGRSWEADFRARAPSYLGDLVRRVRVLTPLELDQRLDAGVGAGQISETDAESVRRADLVCTGRDPDSGAPVFVVVEVSARVAPPDVERAAARAALLAGLGQTTIAVVAGQRLDRAAQRSADATGVRLLQSGA